MPDIFDSISTSKGDIFDNITPQEDIFDKIKGIWNRGLEASGAESEMMGSPANLETLRTVIGGGAAWIPAGIMQAATVGEQGGVSEFGEQLAGQVQEKIVGTPSTDVGKLTQQQISAPFEKLSEKSQEYADIVYDKTGSPILATATRVAGEAIPFVAPYVGHRAVKGAKTSLTQDIKGLDTMKFEEGKPTSITPEVRLTKDLPKEIKAEKPIAPAEKVEPTPNIEPLITEARKYNTAEDFVKAQGYIPIYRGAGKRGFQEVKSTEGGVSGEGVYFYTDPLPARSHATTGGGVITGFAKPEDLIIKGNVAILKDPSKFVQGGKISVENTLSTGAEWTQKTEKALSENKLTSIWNQAQEGKGTQAEKVAKLTEMPAEGKPAKAAVDINKDLVEKGFEGLPDNELARYNPIQKVEEVSKAQALVGNPDFFEMAKGNVPLPQDVHPQVLFNVAINEATKAGNIDMLMDLAKSPIAEQRSLAAQQLGASAWEKPTNNIVKAIQEVKKGRETKVRNPQIKEKVRRVLNEEVKKINLSKEELSWDRFLDKIAC